MKLYKNREKLDKPKWLVGRHNRRSHNTSPEKQFYSKLTALKKTTSKRRLKLVSGVVLFAIAITWVPIAKVACVTETGGACSSLELYKSLIYDNLPPLAVRVVPLINNGKIESSLLTLGSTASVEVSRNWLNVLKVNIIERVPIAIWVNGKTKMTVSQSGHVITEVSKNNDQLVKDALTIRDKTAVSPKPGDGVIDSTSLAWALKMRSEKPVIGYSVTSVELDKSVGEFVMVMKKVSSGRDLRVRFITSRPYEQQIMDVNLSLGYFKKKGRAVNYIDVRLPSATAYR